MTDTPTCPECGLGKLVERRRRYDNHKFISCSRFPLCRYTKSQTKTYGKHRESFQLAKGEAIVEGMVIHHANGLERDNRPENLVEMTRSEHRKLHAEAKRKHKELGWNMEATTRWWMAQREKKEKDEHETEKEKRQRERNDAKSKRIKDRERWERTVRRD